MNILARAQTEPQAANPLKPLDYLQVNRNLRNWPIARDGRARMEWIIDKKGGWRGYLVGSGIGIYLPLDCGIRRHVTGWDLALLFTVTSLAVARKCVAELAITHGQILEYMGEDPESGYNRNKVADALALWSNVEIVWERWYMPGRKRRSGTYMELEIDRPVHEAERGRVVLNPAWVKLATRFFCQLPAPLPTDATQLNLCLLVLGWRRGLKRLPCGVVEKRFRSRAELSKRVGLRHNLRNLWLEIAVEELKDWFARHGGELAMIEDDAGVLFRCRLPSPKAPERPKRAARKTTVAAHF